MNFLDKIHSPSDIKSLSLIELEELAKEIREFIIDIVSRNGGHLSSNLGVVELSLALHYVFDAPKDKIIWDVGHQCYTHKILTGRRNTFHTLRKWRGISGFPRMEESPYDAFGTGHASTSISASLGMAVARDLKKEDFHVIAVIGDGALTGGMAFEALNHAGEERRNLIVILNSNEMSISPTVGTFAKYINSIITNPIYNKLKEDVEVLIKKLPFGQEVWYFAKKIEEGIKGLIVPGAFFQELGFRYFGPIDGHNLSSLIETFQNIKRLKGPLLVHVVTKKGYGYLPAEKDPCLFHATSWFDKKTGKMEPPSLPFTETFAKVLIELAREDERIVAITAAMKEGVGLKEFADIFPDRFFDVGIAEEHAVTFAAGLAASGLRPIVAIYSTFLQRAYDQILHDVCMQSLPVIFCIDRAGVVGEDGRTHQGIFDIAYLLHIPNIVLVAPKDEEELCSILKSALGWNRPVAIRYPKERRKFIQKNKSYKIAFGESEIIKHGKDCFILAVGSMVKVAQEASKILEKEGINVGVINQRFIKPLPKDFILDITSRVPLLVTLEEGVKIGGFGSLVLQLLNEEKVEKNVLCIALPDEFLEQGNREEILSYYGLCPESVARNIKMELLRCRISV